MIALIPNMQLFTKVRLAKNSAEAADLVFETITSRSFRTYGRLIAQTLWDNVQVYDVESIKSAIEGTGVEILTEDGRTAFEVSNVSDTDLSDTNVGYAFVGDIAQLSNAYYGTKQFVVEKVLTFLQLNEQYKAVNTNHDPINHDHNSLLEVLSRGHFFIFNRDDEECFRILRVNE